MKRGIITQKGKAEDEDWKREHEARAGNCQQVRKFGFVSGRFAQSSVILFSDTFFKLESYSVSFMIRWRLPERIPSQGIMPVA